MAVVSRWAHADSVCYGGPHGMGGILADGLHWGAGLDSRHSGHWGQGGALGQGGVLVTSGPACLLGAYWHPGALCAWGPSSLLG
jgi:hypothetical protein